MNLALSVMNLNLCGHRPTDDGPNVWHNRKDLCISIISKYSPFVICTQEGLKAQLDDLEQALPGYAQYGLSVKGEGDPSEEHCSIFYDKDKVELIEGGTFWLSEAPSVPASTSWGATSPCIATWVTLQLKGVQPPGFAFQVMNTCMDHLNDRARRRGAFLTWQHIASLPPTLPVIFCGGFNTEKDSAAGKFLLGRAREHGIVGDMRDAWTSTRRRKNGSFIRTYHAFKGNKQGTAEFLKLVFRALCLCWDRSNQDLHVDWVLFRSRSLAPTFCELVDDHVEEQYPSDHYPIYVEFLLPRNVRSAHEPAQET